MIMKEQESDRIWRQLRFYIEKFFSQPPANDVPKIEYKPRYVALLEMTSEMKRSEFQ
jgi:hypothetical protein